MDPLSFTASLIAVLELTGRLMSYVNNVRHAPRERAQIAQEMSNVYSLLTSLRFRVEEARSGDPWFNQVKLLAAEKGPLDQLRSILEKLVSRADSSSKLKDLIWKYDKGEILEALGQIERLKSLVNLALANDLFKLTQSIKGDVSDLADGLAAIRLQADSELPSKLSAWLDIPDPSSNYTAACKRRQEGTGSWLLQDERFLSWKTSPGSCLWLHGIPGCGKTVLSATIIDSVLSVPDASVSYFYFDFNDEEKRKTTKCLRSLTMQLARQVPDGILEIQKLHTKCQAGQQQPQKAALLSLASQLIQKTPHSYIVLDALDESEECEELMDLVETLLQRHTNCLHFLATSRRERELEERLRPLITAEIAIQATVVDADINLYVDDLLGSDLRLRKWPVDVRNEIREQIADKSHGMFRWAFCQIDALRKCIKLSALRKMLSTLPRTLDETYERILSTIQLNGHLEDAVRVLQWLCFAQRPQSLRALVDMLATDAEGSGHFSVEERLPDSNDIVTICSSLISIKEEATSTDEQELVLDDPIIELAHFSVQEYLLSDRCFLNQHFSSITANTALTEVALIYTLHVCQESSQDSRANADKQGRMSTEGTSLKRSFTRKRHDSSSRYDQYPLWRYASGWWYKHASELPESQLSPRAVGLSIRLFENTDGVLEQWLKSHNPVPFSWSRGRARGTYFAGFRNRHRERMPESSRVGSPLYYAAATRLTPILELLAQRGHDVNRSSDIHPTPLHVAAFHGDTRSAKSIVKCGGDLNRRHDKAGSALQIACASGHVEMVRFLVAHGADLKQPPCEFSFRNSLSDVSTYSGTVLHAACFGCDIEVVRILLEAGADIHDHDGSSRSLIESVVLGFDIAAANSLLETTKLGEVKHGRVHGDYVEIARLIVSQGADPGPGLLRAYGGAPSEIWDTLLEIGAPPEFEDDLGDTCLHRAFHDLKVEVFKSLILHGALPTALDQYGRSCLDYGITAPQVLQRFNISPDRYPTTPLEIRQRRLRQTILKTIQKMVDSKVGTQRRYLGNCLGHCLKYLDWSDEAVIACQMEIIYRQELHKESPVHDVQCDGCGTYELPGVRWVCLVCRDFDLCADCLGRYQRAELAFGLCRGHDYLEIPLQAFDEELARAKDIELPRKTRDWLLDLRERILRDVPDDDDNNTGGSRGVGQVDEKSEDVEPQPEQEHDASDCKLDSHSSQDAKAAAAAAIASSEGDRTAVPLQALEVI